MLTVQCWTHVAVFHNLYSGLTVKTPLWIRSTLQFGGGVGWGKGGTKSDSQAFQKNAYPWFLERVLKL